MHAALHLAECGVSFFIHYSCLLLWALATFVNEAKNMYRSNIVDTHLAKVINFVSIHVLHFEVM